MKKITFKVLFGLLLLFSTISQAQFSESFETGIPASWTVLNGGDANTWISVDLSDAGPLIAHTGVFVTSILYSATAHNDFLVTPSITVAAGVNDRFSFWGRSRDPLFPEQIDVVLSTTTNTETAFTTTLQANVSPASGLAFFNYSYDLSDYIGQTIYIGFKSTTTDQFAFDIDTVVNDAVPFCSEPLNLITSAITDATATINWDAVPGSVNYEYVIDNSATDPAGSGTSVTPATHNATLLTPSTTYYFHVRNNCDAAGFSVWSTVSFTTQAVAVGCLGATFGLFPTDTFTPESCDGVTVNVIAANCYAGEYSNVTVTNGQTYIFTSGTTDFITISTDDGVTATAYGNSPFTWVSTVAGVVRFYSHLDPGCGELDTNRVRSIVCGIPGTETPDYANLQFPPTGTISAGDALTVYGQVYKAGLTDVVPNIDGQAPGIEAWVGISPVGANTNPNTWTNWVVATHNAGSIGNNDEYQANIGNTLLPGTYYYATRFRLNNGPYVYGGTDFGFWDGTTHISGVLTVNGPANDNFANATTMVCGTTINGSTASATLDEDSAPDGGGADLDAPNLWYKYTGSGTAETITLSLCTSLYDTSVLVYTGTSGNLSFVAANDDSCGEFDTRSLVNFNSDGVSTYYITVEGWNVGSTGAFIMNVTCAPSVDPAVPNQTCALALNVPTDGTITNSDNSFGTVNPIQSTCDLFGAIQDVWFSFVAPANGNANCLVTAGTMTSSNFATYSGTCGALVAINCSFNLVEPTTQNLTGLMPGNTYYVQVWSNAIEQGTFTLRVDDGNLSVNNFDTSNFNAFPNPVKDVLNLSYTKNITNVSVFNLLGQEVIVRSINSNQSQIDMSNLAKGTYLVKISADNQTKTIKVIKE